MKTLPVCRNCNSPMPMCFVIDYCEYVCPKCKSGVPFFNGNEKVELEDAEHERVLDVARPVFEAMYTERCRWRGSLVD